MFGAVALEGETFEPGDINALRGDIAEPADGCRMEWKGEEKGSASDDEELTVEGCFHGKRWTTRLRATRSANFMNQNRRF